MTECSVGDCQRNKKTVGMCGMHYLRFWRHGDPIKRKGNANGEGGITSQGYISITKNGKRVSQHTSKCEIAIGKRLPKGAEVHHINGVKTDNRNENLVICQSAGYHQLLHARQKAFDGCGNPDFRECRYCGEFDSVENLYIPSGSQKGHHRKCRQEDRKKC